MNTSPRVSIVITYYNEPEEFLRHCLESVQAQTISDWEAIVVDDGSTVVDVDKFLYQFHDPRIRVIRHSQNRGVGAARNTGFRAACTPLILPVDADDALHPHYLEGTLHALAQNPNANWVLTDFQLFGKSTDIWRFPVPLPAPCPVHLYYVGAGTLMRKRVWEESGGYSEIPSLSSGVDFDFWLGAVERGFRAIHVAQPLYLYRRHAKSMTFTTAICNGHAEREVLYRRHHLAFKILGADCKLCRSVNRGAAFRAGGYLTSSIFSLRKAERWKAIRLAARGFVLQPRNPAIRKQFMRTLFPQRFFAFTQLLKGHILNPHLLASKRAKD